MILKEKNLNLNTCHADLNTLCTNVDGLRI